MAESWKEIEGAWWDRWWASDWSWDGLKGKPVGANGGVSYGGGHAERNLQDYWRRDPQSLAVRCDKAMLDAGELVQGPDGTLWHVAHVPMKWADGAPAKGAWDQSRRSALTSVIAQRVAEAGATHTDAWADPRGPDGRAQLQGAVLLDAPHHPLGDDHPVHLLLDQAFMPGWRARDMEFASGLSCKETVFATDLEVSGVNFAAAARFHDAVFSGAARMIDSTFRANADFSSAIFLKSASFARAVFSDWVTFDDASFSGFTSFTGTQFCIGTRFNRVTFLEMVGFHSAAFANSAGFWNASFRDYAIFQNASFKGEARFHSAIFHADANFEDACFYGAVSFEGGEFLARAEFVRTRFATQPDTVNSQAIVDFAGRRFKGIADFTGSQFHRSTSFRATSFERFVQFERTTFPDHPNVQHGLLSDAQFKDVVKLRGSGCCAFTIFDGAVFGGGVRLDDPGEGMVQQQFQQELMKIITLNHATVQLVLPSAWLAARWSNKYLMDESHDAALRALESGCRVLKQAMEKASDKTREQMFYALELTARRYQRETSRTERLSSIAYGLVANYGRSIARPLCWFVATIPTFSLLYLLIFQAQGAAAEAPLFYQSLTLSLGRVFPFGLWQVTTPEYQRLVLGPGDTGWSFALRGLATLQSLLALIFAFLAGLALRRRFHIN